MLTRSLMCVLLFLTFLSSANAAQCLDVFPSGWRELPPSNEQLINFPANNSGSTLVGNTTLPRGDNLYNNSFLSNNNEVFVGSSTAQETTARLFFRSGVSWQNVKINEIGNPEDLIIVIDGGLQITGGNTVINAIIYVKGTIAVSGNPSINGAVTSVGNADSFNVSYNANYINNADFNGMCEGVTVPTPPVIPLANYRFDECAFTGAAFEVIDQTGSYPATAFGNVDTNDAGQIERFADISSEFHRIETSIPLPSSFSVTTWFKKPSSNSDSRYFALAAMQNGGDLLYLDRTNNWRWGVYNPNTGGTNGTFSFNTLDNNWHHMALVSSGGETQLYIDSVLVDTVANAAAGTLKYIATSADDVNDIDPQAFRAPLDEFMVFDSALTTNQIQSIYSNQNAKNNYDGTTRDAVVCGLAEAVAGRVTLNNTADTPEFTHVCFDTPFSVVPVVFSLPTTANNGDRLALRIRNVTKDGFDIAQVESPEKANPNTPAGNVAQTVDFLAIVEGDYDLDGGAKMRVSTLNTKTYQGREIGGPNRGWETISTADLGFTQTPSIIASIQTMANENVNNPAGPFPISEPFLATTIRDVTNTEFKIALERAETNTGTLGVDEKIGYIAITPGFQGQLTTDISYESFRTNNDIRGINSCRIFNFNGIYIDNPLVIASQNTRAGGDGGWLKRCAILTSSVGFSIVEDRDRDNDTGHINERAGGLALSGTFTDFTGSCGVAFDHFELDTIDGQGLTCEADEITIRACADATCSALVTAPYEVELLVNGANNRTITVTGGSVTTDYVYTSVGNAALSLAQTYQCKGSNTTPCDVTFADTGFIFSNILTQLSGKPSNTGFNNSDLFLQAVRTDNNTGACVGAFPDGGDIPVNLSYNCDDGTCTEALLLSNNGNSYNVTTTLASYPLRFGTDSKATFVINYPDAAQLTLNAQKLIEVEDSDGNNVMKDFNNSSNAFVERPFGFFIDVIGNPDPAATDENGSVFKKAGEDFIVELSAVVWQNNQDGNNDGVPDNGADLSGNDVTVNFGKESAPETAAVTYALVAPSPGVTGALTIINEFTFTDGVASDNSVSYDEVGIISLTANLTDNSYLGVSDVQGHEPFVGRFTPDHFVQTIADGEEGNLIAKHGATASCSMLDWVYTGQLTADEGTIRYLNEPVLTITAYSAASTVTENYIGAFAKLTNVDNEDVNSENKITFSQPLTMHGNLLPLTGEVLGTGTISVFSGGILKYHLPDLHRYVYTRDAASEVAPFDANFVLPFSEFKDSDNVTFKPSSGSTDYFERPHFYQLDAVPLVTPEFDNTVEVRFGRWLLENSFGPETSPLPVTMFTQHFDGTSFITNDEESCLVPKLATKVITGDIGDAGLNLWDYRLVDDDSSDGLVPNDTSASFADVNKSFVSGLYRWLLFSEPGAGKIGLLKVEYQVPPWLQYDWNSDDSFTDNPTATLTFGIYRGNDRIIYQREIEK